MKHQLRIYLILLLFMASSSLVAQQEYVLSSTDQVEVTWFGSDNAYEPTYSFFCPSGETISPIYVFHDWDRWGGTSNYINSIRFGCSALQANGTMGAALAWQSSFGYPTNFGPGNGTRDSQDCYPAFMVGVLGQAGSWVDQLGTLCGDMADVQAGQYDSTLTEGPVGGTGGNPAQRQCPAGYMATGAYVSTVFDGDYVKGVKLVCSKVVTTEERDMAIRLGEIIGKICVNEVYDCPFFNTFDQYLQLSTLHLDVNTDWWESLKFWHTPDASVFDPQCINQDGTYSDCFNSDQTPNEATLIQEGWHQTVHGNDRHAILGIADDRAWTFYLPNIENGGTGPVNGISFHEGCLNGLINVSCVQQSFNLSDIYPLAPIVEVGGGGEHLVNSCHYTIDSDALSNTSLSVDTIVQNKDQYLKLECHSSAAQLNSIALSATSAQHLRDIMRNQYDLDVLNLLSGQIIFGGLGLAAEAAEEGTMLKNILTGINTGLRVKFGLDNLRGFVSGIEAFVACGTAACRFEATVQIMMTGFFLKQDLGDLHKFAANGKLSSILSDLNITNTELADFLDEELQPLIDTTENERWNHSSCN